MQTRKLAAGQAQGSVFACAQSVDLPTSDGLLWRTFSFDTVDLLGLGVLPFGRPPILRHLGLLPPTLELNLRSTEATRPSPPDLVNPKRSSWEQRTSFRPLLGGRLEWSLVATLSLGGRGWE